MVGWVEFKRTFKEDILLHPKYRGW
ncbi:unnamed protein product, partial [Vitis vinifera]|uniref:Uncharacterized protein n=1 Tax=Vitis vinifera TaxID=29760 RepID=D7THA9_VITVI